MSQFVAPGVYTIERDFSDYVAALQATALGLVGTAKKGPLNQPTLCTTPEQYLSIFGEPSANMYGPFAALAYLRRGNQLWYCRVAKTFTLEAFTLSASPSAAATTVTATVGHGLVIGNYVRFRQSGKATSISKVTNVATNTITLETPLLDGYSNTAVKCDLATGVGASTAASEAEVFAYGRIGGVATPLVKFTARNPGQWANFGSGKGIEIVVEDSGQFQNTDPTTGDTITSAGGTPLTGVATTKPSVDTKSDLLALTSTSTVGDLRGVNYDSVVRNISNVALTTNVATVTLDSVVGLAASDSITVTCSNTTFSGTFTITAVNTGPKTITYAKTASNVSSVAATGTVDKTSGEHLGVVYRCKLDTDDTTKIWEAVGVLTKRVKVFYQGRQVEVFDNLIGYDANATNFWDNAIGSPTGTAVSNYVYAEYLGSGAQPVSTYNKTKFPYNPRLLVGNTVSVRVAATSGASATTFKQATGRDGENPGSADYIGEIAEDGTHSGLQIFRKSSEFDINLLAVPAVTLAEVVTEVISVVEDRNDCLGILDTPFGLTVQEAVDWHNGTGPYTGEHSAFVSNKAALYYPWVQVFDPYTQREIWLPPTAVIPAVIAYSDQVGEVWYAPAGVNRGHVFDAIKVEHNVTQGEMEYMYGPGNGNAINPIVAFSQDGITVYGQRTLQRTPTALDRVNVRRMLFFVEKSIATSVRRLVFEQDDPILWNRFIALVTPFLKSMVGRRAIEDFKVVCDASTNTPERRNNNEMAAKLLIIPVKAAEKIILEFTLLPSGANFDEFTEPVV